MADLNWSEWIDWSGGECPIPDDIAYEIKERNGAVSTGKCDASLRGTMWQHTKSYGEYDIVAYRYQLTGQHEVTEAEEEEWQRMEWSKQITDTDDEAKAIEDMVNHPPHYQSDNGIECIDAIRAALGLDGFVAHCRGTAIKYCWRSGKKQAHAEDLRKAAWYLNEAADALEEQ